MLSSIQLCSAALGAAPARFEITSPFLKMNSAGIPRTPMATAEFGLLSTSTLAILILPSISADNSSRAGPICLQGPHHSAQKSTTTGRSEFFTSASKVSSVTATVAIGISLRIGILFEGQRYGGPVSPSRSGGLTKGSCHMIVGQRHVNRRGGPDQRGFDAMCRIDLGKGSGIGAHLT